MARRAGATLALIVVALGAVVAGCGGSDSSDSSGKIALLLPETKTTRYEAAGQARTSSPRRRSCARRAR